MLHYRQLAMTQTNETTLNKMKGACWESVSFGVVVWSVSKTRGSRFTNYIVVIGVCSKTGRKMQFTIRPSTLQSISTYIFLPSQSPPDPIEQHFRKFK